MENFYLKLDRKQNESLVDGEGKITIQNAIIYHAKFDAFITLVQAKYFLRPMPCSTYKVSLKYILWAVSLADMVLAERLV